MITSIKNYIFMVIWLGADYADYYVKNGAQMSWSERYKRATIGIELTKICNLLGVSLKEHVVNAYGKIRA